MSKHYYKSLLSRNSAQTFVYHTSWSLNKSQQHILWLIKKLPHLNNKAKLQAVMRVTLQFFKANARAREIGDQPIDYFRLSGHFIYPGDEEEYYWALNRALDLAYPRYALQMNKPMASYINCKTVQ